MGYIANSLSNGEKVLYVSPLHWIVLVRPLILGIFGIWLLRSTAYVGPGLFVALAIALIVWGSWTLIVAMIKRGTTATAVTNRKVILKQGLIARNTIEQRLEKIESIQVHQTIFGRLFDYGTVQLHGSGGTNSPIGPIGKPIEFRRQVEAATQDIPKR